MRSSLFMPLTGESSRPPPSVLPCAASFLAQITSQSRRIGVHLPRSHSRRGPLAFPVRVADVVNVVSHAMSDLKVHRCCLHPDFFFGRIVLD